MARLRTVKANKKWAANLAELGDRISVSQLRHVKVEKLPSLAHAIGLSQSTLKFQGAKDGSDKAESQKHIEKVALSGDKQRGAYYHDQVPELIDLAIAKDPRLARRCRWVQSEDGLFADPGLVASGDDSPCFDRQRMTVRQSVGGNEPVNVTISTDSSSPTMQSAAAVMAVASIVQQFRPVHIWWQGAWLDDAGREAGYVMLAPILQGDMDFNRIDYVLADWSRDNLSFRAMHAIAVMRDRMQIQGMSRHADWSYIPEAMHVPKQGLYCNPNAIAREAARWLGLDPLWRVEMESRDMESSALQSIPEKVEYRDDRTEAEKERDWKQIQEHYEQERRRKAREAARRLSGVS